ncbi:MAG: sigma-70 region 4 domain protein [Symbiobacteriaceae bacterium]|jgi:DNA-directed RNA polymerase alpha subunit|nr:sigma-70 region 4 domain protein [Symbiobacteriaceae bacterium]
MAWDDLPMETLALPRYAIRFLRGAGVRTVGALLRLDRDALHQVPGMGPRTVDEIMQRREAFLADPEETLARWAEEAWRQPGKRPRLAALPPEVKTQAFQVPVPDWLAEKPLEVMGLPTRLHYVLKAHGIRTMGDLYRLSADDLRPIYGFGPKAIKEIMGKRARLLAGEEPLAPLTRAVQIPWWRSPGAAENLPKAYPDASLHPAPQALATVPVQVVGLANRAVDCLLREGIRTYGDLCRLTAGDLLRIHGLGPSTVRAILEQRRSISADPAWLEAQVAAAAAMEAPPVMTEGEVRIEQIVIGLLAAAGHPLPLAQVAAALMEDADEIRACSGVSQRLGLSGDWCYQRQRGAEASAWTLAALSRIGRPARAGEIARVMREIAPHLGEIQVKTLRNFLRVSPGIRREAWGLYGLRRWGAGAGKAPRGVEAPHYQGLD